MGFCLTIDYSAAVTMQAQGVAPPDMQCKDKFLVQSTVVPFGTSEEKITSDMVRRASSSGYIISLFIGRLELTRSSVFSLSKKVEST